MPAAIRASVRRERHIGFGPALGPEIFIAVEARRSHPVLQREIVAVLMPSRRCSGLLTRNIRQRPRRPGRRGSVRPPDQITMTRLPASAISVAATGPPVRPDHDHVCIARHNLLPQLPADRSLRSNHGHGKCIPVRGQSVPPGSHLQFGPCGAKVRRMQTSI